MTSLAWPLPRDSHMKKPSLESVETIESRPQSDPPEGAEEPRPPQSRVPRIPALWLVIGAVLIVGGTAYLVSESRTYSVEDTKDEPFPSPMQNVDR